MQWIFALFENHFYYNWYCCVTHFVRKMTHSNSNKNIVIQSMKMLVFIFLMFLDFWLEAGKWSFCLRDSFAQNMRTGSLIISQILRIQKLYIDKNTYKYFTFKFYIYKWKIYKYYIYKYYNFNIALYISLIIIQNKTKYYILIWFITYLTICYSNIRYKRIHILNRTWQLQLNITECKFILTFYLDSTHKTCQCLTKLWIIRFMKILFSKLHVKLKIPFSFKIFLYHSFNKRYFVNHCDNVS